MYICCDRGKKQRDYTFIPTSLFRDCSLIKGLYACVCVCVCVCVHVQSSSTPAVIEAKFVIDQDTQLVPAVSGSMELRVYRFPYVCIASFQ